MNCLYKLVDDYKIVGGALLFLKDDELNVGRIFVAPEHFRKGFGIFMMQQIEENFPEVKVFTLDTPIWNVRTNAFYQKLGYSEVRRDGDFVYYEKKQSRHFGHGNQFLKSLLKNSGEQSASSLRRKISRKIWSSRSGKGVA